MYTKSEFWTYLNIVAELKETYFSSRNSVDVHFIIKGTVN